MERQSQVRPRRGIGKELGLALPQKRRLYDSDGGLIIYYLVKVRGKLAIWEASDSQVLKMLGGESWIRVNRHATFDHR
jgi:hypothetical protein